MSETMSEQMREEFEVWVKSLSPNRYLSTERFCPLHGVTEGEYKGFTVQNCWESFQAARKTGFTAVDMGTAEADGFRDGAASHWQPIDTCPKHVDVLFFHERDGVIAGRLTDADSFMTDKERDEFEGGDEAQFCIDAFGFGHWGVCRMDGAEAPSHWMPYPPEPEVKP